jgi:arginase
MGWTAIGVPIDSVGRVGGTEHAPRALREAGLVEALGARDAGDLVVSIRGEERDSVTGIVGARDVLAMTPVIQNAVQSAVLRGERPLLLGGCCALVPGALAGLREATGAPVAVAYVDGHVDVYDGKTSPTGEAADMPLGVAFGLGPAEWASAAGGASTTPTSTVVLGARDPDEAEDIGALLAGPLEALVVKGPVELREEGLARSGAWAAAHLSATGHAVWLALDVDVLDEEAMPATDYLMPGGLGWAELEELLAPIGASPALAGASVACVNPEKDPGGALVRRTAELLAAVLGRTGS